MKAPKPKQLYDVQEWVSETTMTGNVKKRTERLVQVHNRAVSYPLAKWKCDEFMRSPSKTPGHFFKPGKHLTPEQINQQRINENTSTTIR